MSNLKPTFEKFAPHLKSGHVFESDALLIFELDDGSKQVTLPIESRPILPLMDGKHLVEDLIQELYRSQKRVPFKALISTIQKLKANSCLVNGDDGFASEFTTRPEIFDKTELWWERPLMSVPLIKRWSVGQASPILFYFFAASSLLLTLSFLAVFLWSRIAEHDLGFAATTEIYAPQSLLGSAFLHLWGSYLYGILFFIAATSILTSMKTLFRALLAAFAVGRVNNLKLELNCYSLALRMHDDALYLTGSRWRGALSAATVGLSQFLFFAMIQAAFPHWAYIPDLFMISIILAMVDLNPYRKSELTSFFNVVYNRKSVSHLLPYLKSRSLIGIIGRNEKIADETIYTAYSTLAIAWTMVAFNLSIAILNNNAANLLVAIGADDLIEKAAAGIVLGGVGLVTAYLVIDLLRTLGQNLVQPLVGWFLHKKSAGKTKTRSFGNDQNRDQIVLELQKLPLFQNVKAEALQFLLAKSLRRSVEKGATIVVQGASSEELFILLDGEAIVRKRHATGAWIEVARLKAITVFGENTLLENQARSADVIASTKSDLICIPRSAFDMLEGQHSFAADYEAVIHRLQLGQYISGSELFRDAPSEVISLFLNEGQIEHIAPHTDIIRQGQFDKDFYLLIRGSVEVQIDRKVVKTLAQGDFFGEIALLLNQPRIATVHTNEPCTVLKLSADRFWFVISHHLSLALFLETVSEIRSTGSLGSHSGEFGQNPDSMKKELKHG